jgi:hypothetical protein
MLLIHEICVTTPGLKVVVFAKLRVRRLDGPGRRQDLFGPGRCVHAAAAEYQPQPVGELLPKISGDQ